MTKSLFLRWAPIEALVLHTPFLNGRKQQDIHDKYADDVKNWNGQ